ncbi:MAG: hypothetical protein AAGF53_03750 [Pseudomonadota bacterium]
MRETEFFKFVFFNVSSILGAIVVILVIVVAIVGLKHRKRLIEDEVGEHHTDDKMNADIDSDDQAALREVGLSSAGMGQMYYKSDEEDEEDPKVP